jgi:hypothetical protein
VNEITAVKSVAKLVADMWFASALVPNQAASTEVNTTIQIRAIANVFQAANCGLP